MEARSEKLSIVEGLVALAHADDQDRPQRVSLRLYREDPDGERSVHEVTLTLPQAERLGRFFRWFAGAQRRGRRQLRPRYRGRRNESSGTP
jgi:hypothetical protein